MKILRILLAGSVLTSFAIGASLLRAEEETKAEGEDEVTAPIAVDPNLTKEEMAKNARELIDEMRDTLIETVKLQKVAKDSRDVLKINCVNDRLLQMKIVVRKAEDAGLELREAAAKGEKDRYNFLYGKITILSDKLKGLSQETDNCVGEELVFLGPTETTVNDPGIVDDPTLPEAFEWDPEDIIFASPWI